MSDRDDDRGIRDRLSSRGEDALGDLASVMLENPLINQALSTALGAGERAMQAQRSAMDALNIPSADDVERLGRRLRAVSERLEEIEDRLDDVSDQVSSLRRNQS